MSLDTDSADMARVDFTYPFLAHIDLQRPPASITIADKYLAAMGNMERQYWSIKSRVYNVVLFFKKGKFYELYDNDAVLAHREFGLKLVLDTSNRGKMRLAGVPEQSFREWARLFVFRGYKVGRVEQMHADADEAVHNDGSSPSRVCGDGATGAWSTPSKAAKVMPRELVEVLTPGTLTDAAMLSDHSEVYVLALAPAVCATVVAEEAAVGACAMPRRGGGDDVSLLVDAVAVDLSRRVVHWCPCGPAAAVRGYWAAANNNNDNDKTSLPPVRDVALRALSALLQQLQPREVIVPHVHSAHPSTSTMATLQRWVAAEGFAVEAIDMPRHEQQEQQQHTTTTTRGSDDDEEDTVSSSPAHVLLRHYLRHLRLHAALPLLSCATPYADHLTDDGAVAAEAVLPATGRTAATTTTTPQGTRRATSLLEYERRRDCGLVLDAATVSNLELVGNLRDGGVAHTLHAWLNRCSTPAGRRLLRRWLLRPSSSLTVLRARQDVVRYLRDRPALLYDALDNSDNNNNDNDNNNDDDTHATTAAGCKRAREHSATSTTLASRFARLARADFERSLSRLAELKSESQQSIAYVDPLVRYRRHLDLILDTVQSLVALTQWARAFREQCDKFRNDDDGDNASVTMTTTSTLPALLDELLSCIDAAAPSTAALTQLYDHAAVQQSGVLVPARGTCVAYDDAVDALAALQTRLDAARTRVQREAFANAPVHFVDLGKDHFLLEVSARDAPAHTPAGLVERARSAKSVKYAMSSLAELVEAHKAATARRASALLTVLCAVAERVCAHCHVFYAASSALAYVDCLMTLARLCHRYATYCCMPQLCSGKIDNDDNNDNDDDDSDDAGVAVVRGVGLLHPMLLCDEAVANTVQLDAAHGRVLVLTGPNMAGKSTLMRTVAVNVLLAQLGGPALARTLTLAPVDRIYTRIGARDATHKGQSTLYVELSETATLLRGATARSLCLLDELGRGTSTHDGLAVAHATLHTLLERRKPQPPLTIFSTHYHALALEQARQQQQQHDDNNARDDKDGVAQHAQLGYMDFALDGGDGGTHDVDDADTAAAASSSSGAASRITFLYRLVRGVCTRSYGIEVARMAGIPRSLVHVAKAKSDELARRSALHEDVQVLRALLSSS